MERKMQNVQKFVFLNKMKDIDHEIAFQMVLLIKDSIPTYIVSLPGNNASK